MSTEEKAHNHHVVQYLQQIADFLHTRKRRAYLVGGSVRNLLLDEPCSDWDIATDGDVVNSAKQIASLVGGYFVHMHERASRIIVKGDAYTWIFDLSPLQGHSIEADLSARDFTLNALAVPLADAITHLSQGARLSPIDPFNGVNDLAQRQLRMVHDTVLQVDPLRMLRAVRFVYRYHLKLAEKTGQALKRDAPLLLQVASERIHEELFAILQPQGSAEVLRFLDSHNLLTTLIPELLPAKGMPQPSLHHWDVFDHSLEAVAALEQLSTVLQQDATEIARFLHERVDGDLPSSDANENDLLAIQQLLFEAQQQGLFQLASLHTPIVKLGVLLHDIGKTVTYAVDDDGNITFYHHPQDGVPLAQQIMQRLHASVQESRLVQQIVAHHMRPGQLSHDTVTLRATRRYFVDLGPMGIIVAIVSLSDHLAMRGPEPLTEHWWHHLATVRLLLQRYIRERESIIPPRLLQANEMIQRLNLQPGPMIGQLLESIAEAQADGIVQSKEDALWFAEEQLKRMQQEHNG
jgi:putative nucleotidyltransferase with HDIG domain